MGSLSYLGDLEFCPSEIRTQGLDDPAGWEDLCLKSEDSLVAERREGRAR